MEKRNSTFMMSSPNRKLKGNPVMLRGGNCALLAQEEPCLSSNILYLVLVAGCDLGRGLGMCLALFHPPSQWVGCRGPQSSPGPCWAAHRCWMGHQESGALLNQRWELDQGFQLLPQYTVLTLRTCKLLCIPTSHLLLKMWVCHKENLRGWVFFPKETFRNSKKCLDREIFIKVPPSMISPFNDFYLPPSAQFPRKGRSSWKVQLS